MTELDILQNQIDFWQNVTYGIILSVIIGVLTSAIIGFKIGTDKSLNAFII